MSTVQQSTLWEMAIEDDPQCCGHSMLCISHHPDDVTHQCLMCGSRYQKGLHQPFVSFIRDYVWGEKDRVWLLHLASLVEGWHK